MSDYAESIFAELTSVLEEEGIEPEAVNMDTKLKDLELSSMQFLRVVGALEDLMGIPLDAGLGDVETVGDLVNQLVALKKAAA